NFVTTLTIPEPSVWAIAPGMFAPNRKTSAIITDLLRFNSLPPLISANKLRGRPLFHSPHLLVERRDGEQRSELQQRFFVAPISRIVKQIQSRPALRPPKNNRAESSWD